MKFDEYHSFITPSGGKAAFASRGSAVVEQSTTDPEVKGSKLALYDNDYRIDFCYLLLS
jgi:hypothetical protein